MEKSKKKDILILFSKIPILNKTKTRLKKFLEIYEIYEISLNLLLDTLQNQSKNDSTLLVWYFAPLNERNKAIQIIQLEDYLKDYWILEPMPEYEELTSSSLSDFLIHAINNIITSNFETCTFIASDTPHLSSKQVIKAQEIIKSSDNIYDAYICPATDGGYVMLTLCVERAKQNVNKIFENVEWSCERTCNSQIRALQSAGFNVFIGPIYRDIDEIEDLIFIYELFGSNSQIQPQSQLESPSSSSPNSDLLLSDEQNTPLYTFPSRTINYYSTIHSNIISQIV